MYTFEVDNASPNKSCLTLWFFHHCLIQCIYSPCIEKYSLKYILCIDLYFILCTVECRYILV